MKIQSPPVGMPVQFFPGGIRDRYRQPWSGRVVESGQDGCVKIVCDVPGGGSVGNNEFHRWMGDTDWIKQNTQFLAKASGTMPRGCWDYVPGLEPGEPCPEGSSEIPVSESEAKKATADRRQRGVDMVVKLLAEGKDFDDIAKCVRGYGLNKADVEKIVSEAEVPA